MSQAAAIPFECEKCPSDCTPSQVPGPAGKDGEDGLPGVGGANSYGVLLSGFTMPAISSTVTAEVDSTAWMVESHGAVDGQVLVVEFAGSLMVVNIVDDTHAELLNLGYTGNAGGGTLIPVGSRVGVGGLAGATGGTPGGALLAVNNLSDLTNAPTARGSLGLGTAALLAATDFLTTSSNLADVPVKATARTNLGLAIGTNVQAFNAFLAGLATAGPGAADLLPYLTAANTFGLATLTAAMRALLASASNAALLTTLKVFPRSGLLGSVAGANMNSVLDQAVTINSSKYRVTGILVTNASVNLTTAQGGVYNAVGKPGGGVLVAAGQVYTALSASAKFVDLTLGGVALTDVQTAGFLYLSLSVAQGVAATCDFYVFGEDMS